MTYKAVEEATRLANQQLGILKEVAKKKASEARSLYSVQYADKNASMRDYKHLAKDELLITSIFETIQGEGPYAGHPATFIRFAGCNRGDKEKMGCSFCDTRFHLHEGKIYTIDQIVTTTKRNPARLVVITGGEPMIQNNIVALLEALWKEDKKVQIESNGDRVAGDYLKGMATLVVSPKITGSTYKPLKDRVANAVDYLKFVVDARPESPYNALPLWVFERNHSEIYVSPLAAYKRAVAPGEIASFWKDDLLDKQLTSANYAYAAWLAQINNFRLSVQQHLLVNIE